MLGEEIRFQEEYPFKAIIDVFLTVTQNLFYLKITHMGIIYLN